MQNEESGNESETGRVKPTDCRAGARPSAIRTSFKTTQKIPAEELKSPVFTQRRSVSVARKRYQL